MNSYLPIFCAAAFEEQKQQKLISKFGGYPWGLPKDKWSLCQDCKKPMSLLAQLCNEEPVLNLIDPDYVFHLFQCLECFGYETGHGNDAVFIGHQALGEGLTEPPDEIESIGELWISGWESHEDILKFSNYSEAFEFEHWEKQPEELLSTTFFDSKIRTKMGGIPYWTWNGPQNPVREGYKFLLQLDQDVNIQGTVKEEFKSDYNAPHQIYDVKERSFSAEITNFGTDGTAYVFINIDSPIPIAYWYWTR